MFACTLPPRRVVVTRDETGQSATRAIAKIDILEVIERLDVRAGHQCHYRDKVPVVQVQKSGGVAEALICS
jgi:hypothetical protein